MVDFVVVVMVVSVIGCVGSCRQTHLYGQKAVKVHHIRTAPTSAERTPS